MIGHAKRRNIPGSIIYHAAAIGNVQLLPGSFDVIITPFLFDNFTQWECDSAFRLLHHSLAHKGRWLFTDFQQTRRLWHKMLLRSMYLFFGLLAGIKARSLPDTAGLFSMADYEILDEQKFMKGFIVSSVFEKGE